MRELLIDEIARLCAKEPQPLPGGARGLPLSGGLALLAPDFHPARFVQASWVPADVDNATLAAALVRVLAARRDMLTKRIARMSETASDIDELAGALKNGRFDLAGDLIVEANSRRRAR